MNRREFLFNMTGGRCFYCGCLLDFNNFHLDHIVPKSKGGKNPDNLVPACIDCNEFKSDLSVKEFRQKIMDARSKTIQGRILAKYYKLNHKGVRFFCEDLFDGTL